MTPGAAIATSISDGLENFKRNFWPYILIIVILGIIDSIGKGPVIREAVEFDFFYFVQAARKSILIFVIAFLVKPVFDFGAKLVVLRGNRGEAVELADLLEGFRSKEKYVDIIITHFAVTVMFIGGLICLVLPGVYLFSRLLLSSYLVMDKNLDPKRAIRASWVLMRGYWPVAIVLMLISFAIMIGGICLLLVGLIPAFAWVKSIFAAFYQRVLDAHTDEYLLSLDIEP